MAPTTQEDAYTMMPKSLTAVAVDKDKNSPCAVRWAIDHLAISSQLLVMVHVKPKINKHQISSIEYGYFASGLLSDADIDQIFEPFRSYCVRRGVELREVILEDNDICRALLDYIHNNAISNFVLGASTRYAFTRKFKSHDLTSTMLKSAPDFCNVYIISKGKVVSVRQAKKSAPVPRGLLDHPLHVPPRIPSPKSHAPPTLPSPTSRTSPRMPSPTSRTSPRMTSPAKISHERIEMEERHREHQMKKNVGTRKTETTPSRQRSGRSNEGHSAESIDLSNRSPQSMFSQDPVLLDIDLSRPHFVGSSGQYSLGSNDKHDQNGNVPVTSGSPSPRKAPSALSASSGLPQKELEDEMRRLKLEIRRTRQLYSTARKEVYSVKERTKELSEWKLEEAHKYEEAKLAQEAVLALAEKEKAKYKTAMEQADVAHRLAEKEAQRRRHAELKAKQEGEEKNRPVSSLPNNHLRCRRYTIDEIEVATGRFSESNRIGEGGYGPVFKGKIDHTPVAIKLLRPDAVQGRRQFQQEVEVLSCIRHPHMVLLLGACPQYGCLVYEYMSKGSLEDRLLQRGNTPPLSWRQRFSIAAEIATGLLFLHQTKPEPLVHRDLKPANILLDRNYVSKISDVGLARLVPPEVADTVTRYHMTAAAGTFYYIDPEYQQTGKLTTKSDIYSLGIMLLQIITAKTPMGLSHHVAKAVDKGNLTEVLDPAVTDWPMEETLSFAKLALQCTELRKRDRPDLGRVILPELDRLRDLAMNLESDTGNYGYSRSSSHSLSHTSRSSPRISSASQESRYATADDETKH